MESTIVIKVNYGKTLRRFNACVDEAGKLELSLDVLRQKVLSLFSLSPEVDLTLTYLDEDGDSVTLADDDDLSDVMMQSLNPLRITAEVKSERGNTSFSASASARSSENSTPIRSPKISQPLPDLNRTFSEIFKAVPEPLGETLTKLSLDLASKAVSSPQLPELVQHFSKMLQSNMKAQSVGTESSSPSSMTKEPEALGGDSAKPKVIVVPKNSSNQRSGYERKVDAVFCNPGTNTPYFPKMLKCYVKAQSGGAESSTPSSMAIPEALGGATVKPKVVDVPNSVNQPSGYENKTDPIFRTPVFNTVFATEPSPFDAKVGQLGDDKEQVKKSDQSSLEQEALKAPLEDFKTDLYPFKNVNFGGNTSAGPFNHNIARQCPFGRVPNDLVSPYNPFAPQLAPPLRRNNHGVDGVFHTGIVCDGCEARPITGPRFKSKVKENYDLCSICFAKMGSVEDYIRLDHPVPYRHHHFKGPLHPPFVQNSRVNHPPTLPQALQNVVKPKLPKLDSRFIMDVNVIDGTMMAPLTSFTKIWRMRNNSTVVWPHGSQLVWIGGDRLSASLSTGLQIPVDGIAVENELDVAVDFTAPELPGRYISYWRMATPSGQKFGQRVWVLIQVDASAKDSSCHSNWQGLNLNFPPWNEVESIAINAKPVIVDGQLPIIEPSNINVEHIAVDGRIPIPELSNSADDLVEPLVVTVPTKNQDRDFPINDNLLVSGTNTQVVAPTIVSYPIVDSSAVPAISASLAPPTPLADAEKWEEAWVEKDDDGVEQTLLRELEEMGFKQVDLNKEILRMNKYNLEQSVDDLCGVSEWDPILEELQEMGFCDNEVNKKLLKKNNGSIKDVVMDLINGEKA